MPGGRFSLNHMELYVTDLEAMRAFYTATLGFTVTDESGAGENQMVFLSHDPAEHHQLVLTTGRPARVDFNTINHISFRLESVSALRKTWEKVNASSYGPIEQANHGISWSLYFRDPEQNRLECFVDTPWYTPQPFRVPLDLSLPDGKILRQTEGLCRSRHGFLTREDWMNEVATQFPA